MPTIREMITKFSFQVDTSPLTAMRQGLASAGQDLKKNFDTTPMKNSEEALNRVVDRVVGVKESFKTLSTIGLAIGAAVGAISTGFGVAFAGLKQSADYADRVSDTAAQLGIARNELQALGYVAQLSGSNVEEMSVSLRFLARNAVESAENAKGPAAEGFRKLGVSVKDSTGQFKSSTQLLEEMAEGFARLPEGPERTALAMDLLGKSGAAMVPLLSQGSAAVAELKQEAYDLGFVMSDEALDAGAAFNDELDRMTAVVTGIKNTVGGALLPMMTGWVTKIRELIVANRDIIAQKLESVVKGITIAFQVAWNVISTGYNILKTVTDLFGGLENIAKWVGVALLALGGLAILSGIGTLATAVGGLIAALVSLNAAAIASAIAIAANWIAAAAIPILIGAAIVGIGLLFEDIWTYLQGGESVFGKWVKVFDEFVDSVMNMGRAIGEMLYDNIIQPFIDGYDVIADIAKKILGIDVAKPGGPIKAAPRQNFTPSLAGAAGDFGTRALPGPMSPEFFDTRGPGSFYSPSIAPSAAVSSAAASSSSSTSIQNQYTINANGLDEDQARRVVSEEVQKSQTDMFKRAGQNSIRKNRE